MANNWEDVAQYLLRNRSIREMVDEVLNSLEETDCDMFRHTVKKRDQKNKNKKYGKKKPGRLGIRQRQQLEKQYHLRKEITQETMEEIAMELNLSFARVKKWFNNRQKRETLRMKRNGIQRKVNTTQHTSIRLNDYFTNEIQSLQIKNMSVLHRNNLLHSNTQSNVGMNCDVLPSDEIEITAVKKCHNYKQNNEKTVRGFVVTQDENGICVLCEQ